MNYCERRDWNCWQLLFCYLSVFAISWQTCKHLFCWSVFVKGGLKRLLLPFKRRLAEKQWILIDICFCFCISCISNSSARMDNVQFVHVTWTLDSDACTCFIVEIWVHCTCCIYFHPYLFVQASADKLQAFCMHFFITSRQWMYAGRMYVFQVCVFYCQAEGVWQICCVTLWVSQTKILVLCATYFYRLQKDKLNDWWKFTFLVELGKNTASNFCSEVDDLIAKDLRIVKRISLYFLSWLTNCHISCEFAANSVLHKYI